MATGPVAVGGQAGDDIYDVKISWRHGASIHQTGFSVREAAAEAGSAQTLAGHVDTALRAGIRGLLTQSDVYLGVDAVRVRDKTGFTVAPAGVLGLSAGALGPGFVAAVASLKGELRSRYGHGRMFLPVYFEGQTDFESLTTTGTADLMAFLTAFINEYVNTGVGSEWKAVNWHRTLPAGRPNGTKPSVVAVPATWYDVQSVRLNSQVTSLKSRRQGIGS